MSLKKLKKVTQHIVLYGTPIFLSSYIMLLRKHGTHHSTAWSSSNAVKSSSSYITRPSTLGTQCYHGNLSSQHFGKCQAPNLTQSTQRSSILGRQAFLCRWAKKRTVCDSSLTCQASANHQTRSLYTFVSKPIFSVYATYTAVKFYFKII